MSVNSELFTVNQGGFTFVEIMIVLAVIGILVTMAQPSFSTSVWRAREATLKEDLFIFRDVIDQYYADQGEYPPTLEALVEMRYLRKIPKDPITATHDTWLVVYAFSELGEEEGIFDVKSGSDMVGLDGTAYTEW
jgi:general secretion pathway protein G